VSSLCPATIDTGGTYCMGERGSRGAWKLEAEKGW